MEHSIHNNLGRLNSKIKIAHTTRDDQTATRPNAVAAKRSFTPGRKSLKLVRYGERGRERPGMIDDDGILRSLASLISDFTPKSLESLLDVLASARTSSLPICPPGSRLGPPILTPSKIICVGLNYRMHAIEAGMAIPSEPVVFLKAPSSLSGPHDPVMLPPQAAKADWEVELGVVIGRSAKTVSIEAAPTHILGYCVVNDVSERAFQLKRGGQWTKGKSADTFCPVGPYLVTRDEVSDPQTLQLRCDISGVVVQTSNTSDMIFTVAEIVSYLSSFMTLEPGDLICTGTPHGVGHGQTPPRYLKINDVMTLSIEGLGEQRQLVAAFI